MNRSGAICGALFCFLLGSSLPLCGQDRDRAMAEKEACIANLKKINAAILAFRKERKDIPQWLSDLLPKYISDTNVLICPVSARTGENHGMPFTDPRFNTSYLFEFNPAPLGNIWGGGAITMREWKRKQMGVLGGEIPIVRCLVHQPVLNLSFSGNIYESELEWEAKFADVADRNDLTPQRLVAREASEGKGTETPEAKGGNASGGSPQEAYAELTKAYNKEVQDFSKKYQEAKTDAERQKLTYPNQNTYAEKFLKIAEADPKSTTAFDSYTWVLSNNGYGTSADRALDGLMQHHVASPKMASVCQRLLYNNSPKARGLLKTLAANNPSREVKGWAHYALARQMMASGNSTEGEKEFTLVSGEYGDVKAYRGTLAEMAERDLFELRNLAVGKVAPEIAGRDLDGKEFKLSDYRGKIVVLDFWGDW